MKTQVSKKAVCDFLKFAHLCGFDERINILKTLLFIEPFFETHTREEIENLIIEREFQRNSKPDKNDLEFILITVFYLIRELDYYIDKRAVIESALEKIIEVQNKQEMIEKLVPEVKAAFGNLDMRTKELFSIFSQLMNVDTRIDTDFANEIFDAVEIQPSIIRGEPALNAAVQAYDLADVINETIR
jgi:hypothetical protein